MIFMLGTAVAYIVVCVCFILFYAVGAFLVGVIIFRPTMHWVDGHPIAENIWSICFTIYLVIALLFCFGQGIYRGVPEMAIEDAAWGESVNYVTHEIINLADNNQIEGTIHGGRHYIRGYIGETTTYHYYYQQRDGGMKLQKASEDNTTIYFTNGNPRAEWYRQTKSFWWKSETRYFCRIYIPEGSMTTEFTIDMK